MKKPIVAGFNAPDDIDEKPVVWTGEDELRLALKSQIDKGMKLTIDESTRSWIASYNGAEDSGSLSVPLPVIIRNILDRVARGAIRPRKHNFGELAGAMMA